MTLESALYNNAKQYNELISPYFQPSEVHSRQDIENNGQLFAKDFLKDFLKILT